METQISAARAAVGKRVPPGYEGGTAITRPVPSTL